jgi:hypothetical protein
MKGRRAHLKKQLLIQSDRLDTVVDTDEGVRRVPADEAGVDEGARMDGVEAAAVLLDVAGAARLLEEGV